MYTQALALVGLAPGVAAFSPLVFGQGDLQVGRKWRTLDLERLLTCSRAFCSAEASVVGTEKVTLAAGSFEAVKIAVFVQRQGGHPLQKGSGEYEFWYSTQARRLVKGGGVSRGWFNVPNFEFELLGYKLN